MGTSVEIRNYGKPYTNSAAAPLIQCCHGPTTLKMRKKFNKSADGPENELLATPRRSAPIWRVIRYSSGSYLPHFFVPMTPNNNIRMQQRLLALS